jgi:hypothetical protein
MPVVVLDPLDLTERPGLEDQGQIGATDLEAENIYMPNDLLPIPITSDSVHRLWNRDNYELLKETLRRDLLPERCCERQHYQPTRTHNENMPALFTENSIHV